MSAEQNAWVMTTYVHKVAGEGQLDLIDEIANEDMVDLGVVAAGGPAGRDGLRLHVRGAHVSMADRVTEIKRLVATDDEVMAWWTMTGTHSAPWLGVETTGRRIGLLLPRLIGPWACCVGRPRAGVDRCHRAVYQAS